MKGMPVLKRYCEGKIQGKNERKTAEKPQGIFSNPRNILNINNIQRSDTQPSKLWVRGSNPRGITRKETEKIAV